MSSDGAMTPLRVVSGVGGKGPACFLVETGGVRLMLDLGEGPDVGDVPDLDGVGPVDAVLITHTHVDHAAGLHRRGLIGAPPVHATALAARLLPNAPPTRALPARGVTTLCGIPVTTGRSGHAPGGVWIHLGVAGGVLYMGDHSDESALYPFDPPPPARLVILDASYGVDDTPQAARLAALEPLLHAGGALFPAAAAGRGPELALWALERGVVPALDDAHRAMIGLLLDNADGTLRPGAADRLRRLLDVAQAPGSPEAVTIAAGPNAASGTAGALVRAWAERDRPAIVFTGYLAAGTPSRMLVEAGRARFLRWNVHPTLSQLQALVRATGAEVVMPAFGAARHAADWRAAFAPARVVGLPD